MNTRSDRQGCACFMTRFILSKIYQNIRNSSYIYQATTSVELNRSKKYNCFQLDLCRLNMEYATRGVSLFCCTPKWIINFHDILWLLDDLEGSIWHLPCLKSSYKSIFNSKFSTTLLFWPTSSLNTKPYFLFILKT